MIEQTNTPKYQVQADHARGIIVGDNATQHITYFQDSPEQWLIEESLDDVRSASFVPPSRGELLLQKIMQHNLLLLHGTNRMGKAALARWVAATLQSQNGPTTVLKIRPRSELQDVINFLNKQQQLIVLGYDVDPTETEEILQDIGEVLKARNNFVILTLGQSTSWAATYTGDRNYAVEVRTDFPYTSADLKRLLEKRLGKRLHMIRKKGGSTNRLLQTFASPSKIVRLTEILATRSKLPDAAEWQELLNIINDVEAEARSWLRSLDKNERLLVLTLALFDGLPEQSFWEIYERIITIMQERDPTLLLLDYYSLYASESFISMGQRISLKETGYRNVILTQLLREYRRSLIRGLSYLQSLVEENAQQHSLTSRDIRLTTAYAVGLISTVEWSATENVLLAWATHPSASVRAATSHAFRQRLETLGDDDLLDILAKLERWLRANSPDRDEDTPKTWSVRWTVASCLGRIGSLVPVTTFEDEILPRLSSLAQDENYQVRASVVYAFGMAGLSKFPQVQQALGDKSLHWHPRVQDEIARTLYRLSIVHWVEVHDLLVKWLRSNDDRLCTAFRTVLLLGEDHPSVIEELYELAQDNQIFRTKFQTFVNELLREQEEIDIEPYLNLGNLVRNNKPADSYLLIAPLVSALDHRFPKAEHLMTLWNNTSKPDLLRIAHIVSQRVANIRADREEQWEIMLTQYLDNEVRLQDFAESLPPDERETFWRDVETERAERKAAHIRHQWKIMLNSYLYDEEKLRDFAAILSPNERKSFWRDVEMERAKRKAAHIRHQWKIMLNSYLYDEEKLRNFAAILSPNERKAFWRDVKTERAERKAAYKRQMNPDEERQQKKQRQNFVLVIFVLMLLLIFICCVYPALSSFLESVITSLAYRQ